MTEISKQLTEVVSFEAQKPKITSSNKHILNLLKISLETKRVICREDIYNVYIDWRFGKGALVPFWQSEFKWVYVDYLQRQEWRDQGKKVYLPRMEWIEKRNYKACAIAWFKNNLGAVILKGKLIVLPIIEIE